MSCPIVTNISTETCVTPVGSVNECYPDPPTESVPTTPTISCSFVGDPIVVGGGTLVCTG